MPRWLPWLRPDSDRASERLLEAQNAALRDLSDRVRELEAERVSLLAEWAKTRDQVMRHLQRVAQRQALDEQRAQRADPAADLSRQILSLKMRGGAP